MDNGVVTLAGRPESDELGRQIVEAVRHVDGVVAVAGPAVLFRLSGSPRGRDPPGRRTRQPGPGPGLTPCLPGVTVA